MNLIYLAEPEYGGWVTFTAHLALSFKSLKHHVKILKYGKKRTLKPFSHGLQCEVLPEDMLLSLAAKSIIVAVDKHHLAIASQLLMNGAKLVIHDPNEFHEPLLPIVKAKKKPIITIRKTVQKALQQLGLDSIVIPHPFISQYYQPQIKTSHACSYSRIDFDKHTEIIVEANRHLNFHNAIKIYGAINRMYAFIKLKSIDPNWETNYYGKFPKQPDAAEKIAARNLFTIDLSVIKNDGGGTQYTFLEAWAQRSHLIINAKWLMPNDVLQDGLNCTAVKNASELITALRGKPNEFIIENGFTLLANHKPERVIPLLLNM